MRVVRARKQEPRGRGPNPRRAFRWRISESLRCVRPVQPCSQQRDRLVQERGTPWSLVAARGDGARQCPPKAQPSPPPRDLVQRSFELCVLLFVLCPVAYGSQSTKYQVQSTKYQVARSLPRLLRYKDPRACGLETCPAPKLPGTSDTQGLPRRQLLPRSYEATGESTSVPGCPPSLADRNSSSCQGTFVGPGPSTAAARGVVRSTPTPAADKSARNRLSNSRSEEHTSELQS